MRATLLILPLSIACLPEIEKDQVSPVDDSEPPVDDSELPPTDADGDGHAADVDCDDQDANIHPGATEVCDGLDNNCANGADEDLMVPWYTDADHDNYGDLNSAAEACSQIPGTVSTPGDCDDQDADVHPAATEVCDGVDNNCDGTEDPSINALHFETSDSVSVPHHNNLDFGRRGSVEAWVYWEGDGYFLFEKFTLNAEDKFMSVYGSLLTGGMRTTSAVGGYATSAPTTVATNQWTHLAMSWDDGDLWLFINGVLVGSTSLVGSDPSNAEGNLQIGQVTRPDANEPFPGLQGFISDFRISSTTRYSADFTPEPDLQFDADTSALYKMNEGNGGAVTEYSGDGYNGNILGATWDLAPCRY